MLTLLIMRDNVITSWIIAKGRFDLVFAIKAQLSGPLQQRAQGFVKGWRNEMRMDSDEFTLLKS